MNRTELQDRLTAYLNIRKALGTSVGTHSRVLDNFVEFAGAQETTGSVTSKLVFDWLDATTKQRCAGDTAKRLSLVRQFLLHLSAALPDTQVPELRLIAGYRRPTPFVFTPIEIELLLKEAADFMPGEFSSVVLHTILGLISATGLRASEALGLDRTDVMPRSNPGTLLIREAKFHKSRLVPLHPSTAEQLAVYGRSPGTPRLRLAHDSILVSSHRRRLSYGTLRRHFRTIIDRVGLRAHQGSNEPTLHSLRHSFVVARLRSWHEEGLDVESRLAHLATYLGHVDFRDTYWYMTATPELLSAATSEFKPPACAGGEQ